MKISTLFGVLVRAALVPGLAGTLVSAAAFANIYVEYRKYQTDFSIEEMIKDTLDLPVGFRGGLTHSQDLVFGCISGPFGGPHYGEDGAATKRRCEQEAAEEQAEQTPCIADIRRAVHDISHVNKSELDQLLKSEKCSFYYSIGPRKIIGDSTFWWTRIDEGWAIGTPVAILAFLTAFNLARLEIRKFGLGLSRAGLLLSALTAAATAGAILWHAKFDLDVVGNHLVNTSLAAFGLAECFALSAVSAVKWVRSGFAVDRSSGRWGSGTTFGRSS